MQDLHTGCVTPGCLISPRRDAARKSLHRLQKIQGDVANDDEILGGIVRIDLARILA